MIYIYRYIHENSTPNISLLFFFCFTFASGSPQHTMQLTAPQIMRPLGAPGIYYLNCMRTQYYTCI